MSLDSAALCLWCTVLGTRERGMFPLFVTWDFLSCFPTYEPVSLSNHLLTTVSPSVCKPFCDPFLLLGLLGLLGPLHLAQLYQSTNFSKLLLTKILSATAQPSTFPTILHRTLNRSQSLCYLIGYLPSFWRLLWLLHLKSERKKPNISSWNEIHKSLSFISSVTQPVAVKDSPACFVLTTVCTAFSRQPGLGFQARAVAELPQHYPARWEGTSFSAPALKTFPFLQFFLVEPISGHFHFHVLLCAVSCMHFSTDCSG